MVVPSPLLGVKGSKRALSRIDSFFHAVANTQFTGKCVTMRHGAAVFFSQRWNAVAGCVLSPRSVHQAKNCCYLLCFWGGGTNADHRVAVGSAPHRIVRWGPSFRDCVRSERRRNLHVHAKRVPAGAGSLPPCHHAEWFLHRPHLGAEQHDHWRSNGAGVPEVAWRQLRRCFSWRRRPRQRSHVDTHHRRLAQPHEVSRVAVQLARGVLLLSCGLSCVRLCVRAYACACVVVSAWLCVCR